MLLTIASGLAFGMISSKLAENIRGGEDFWNNISLRALIVLSLSFHLILIGIAYGKNKKGKAWIHHLTWISYYVGDWVATFSLAILLNRQEKEINALEVLWAPFLLLHLGSAETLAAHFVDEAELWTRYFIGLLIQAAIAVYVYYKLRTGTTAFIYIANLIFVAAIIKCVERIWILRSSSFNQIRKSVLTASPPDSFTSMTDTQPKKLEEYLRENIIPQGRYLYGAYLSFKMFLPLFCDLKLGIYKKLSYVFNLESISTEEAFKMAGTELGFLYDMLYTNTILRSSVLGLILRSIFLLSSITAFSAFSVIISKHFHDSCSYFDIIVTYLLLSGAIVADMLALGAHIFSKWTVRQWINYNNTVLPKHFNKVVTRWLEYRKGRNGIKYMGQHSLLEHCLRTKAKKFTAAVVKIDVVDVPPDLKEFIFSHLKLKREQYEKENFELTFLSRLTNNGAYELLKSKRLDAALGWSLKELEFAHSLLLWHIATEILYYNHQGRYQHCRTSKLLSDYMMHLLAKCPFMLQIGIGELRFRDTCWEAKKLLRQKGIKSKESAAATLLCLDGQCRDFVQKRGKGKSALFSGCRLAFELHLLVQKGKSESEIWELIKMVWVEMLVSAAYHCQWKDHAKQLANGGELLTHVALLMAHLGLSKHICFTEPTPELNQLEGSNPAWQWENLNHLPYYFV